MYILLTVLQRMFIHTIRFGNIYSNQRLNHRRSIARISTCFLSLQDDTPWFWRNAIVDCLKRCVTPDLLANLATFVTIDLLFLEIHNKLDNEYLNVDDMAITATVTPILVRNLSQFYYQISLD